jgi:uncharacterized protein (TIGR04222 family)
VRNARLAGALLVAAAVAVPAGPARAQTFEHITSYGVTIDVRRSGTLHVVETIEYDFGVVPKHGIFRTIPRRFRYDGEHDRVYPIHDVRVSGSPGTPLQFEKNLGGGSAVIKIGDPKRTITGAHRYVIAYDVDGALNRFEGHDELYWNAVGTEWATIIERVDVVVRAEDEIGEVACFAGPKDSRLRCGSARAAGNRARFTNPRLFPFSGVTIVAALPAGYAARPGPILVERWSIDKAFERSRKALTLAGLVLLAGLGGIWYLLSRKGRDRYYAGQIPGLEPAGGEAGVEDMAPVFGSREGPVEWTPPKDMSPALMGVLIDESADPLDVTATIVDLAVRGFLRIDELPREGLFRKRDWQLSRLEAPMEGVAEWESALLGALFRSGAVVTVSGLKNSFHTDLAAIQDRLYDEVVRRGWFTRRPDTVRGRWYGLGILLTIAGVGVTYALARWTHLGLAGIPVLVTGLLMLAVHRRMPSRTAKGSAALSRALGFRRYLATAEANQLRFEEQEGIFARYLPYAVVLGETERWARAFKDLGTQQQQNLYWYGGPHGWSAHDFTDSMGAFTTSTAGTLASTPSSSGSSGFSGGGSSGGGGGGGGGGSW